MDTPSSIGAFLSVLLVGMMYHVYWDWRTAGNDGSFALWTRPVSSKVERWARYSWYAFLGSSLAAFLPVSLEFAVGMPFAFLFAHGQLLNFRD